MARTTGPLRAHTQKFHSLRLGRQIDRVGSWPISAGDQTRSPSERFYCVQLAGGGVQSDGRAFPLLGCT